MASNSRPVQEMRSKHGFFRKSAKQHPVFLFFLAAYLLGWGMVTPRILSWLGVVSFHVPDWWVAASFYAPCIAALWVQWLAERNLRVCRVYESWRKLVLGIVVGAFLVLVCNTVIPALIAERSPLQTLRWMALFSSASYRFHFSDLLIPIGEEIGWRGFALPRLQTRFGPLWASLLIGLMWAGFMLPALTMVQMWMSSFIVMFAFSLIALSIEMTFAMNLSGFSIIVAVVMHTLAAEKTSYLSRDLIAHAEAKPHWEWIWVASNLIVPVLLIFVTWGKLAMRSSKPIAEGQTAKGISF